MRAVTVREPGGPEVLEVREVDDPQPAYGEVVVDVVAAGVNRADLLQRQGHYPPPKDASRYLGLECSGTIATVGEGVRGWNVGDQVCALLAGGGYAEQVAVPAEQLLPIPAGCSMLEAAALPEAACTVWSNLVMTAGLAEGERVLIHGGGSGIGTMAIQVSRWLGAVPYVTVGSESKAAACRELGAAKAIRYDEEDFVDAVMAETDGGGVDVVLDIMGAKYLDSNLRALASGGRLVVIGLQGGVKAELNLGRLLSKRLSVAGTTLRARSAKSKGVIVREVINHVLPAVASGAVHPVVGRVVSLDEADQAHRLLEARLVMGKVVLRVSDST